MKSNLQIISGNHRGKKLYLPSCARPTQNLAREALFNILNTELLNFNQKYCVWDVFAGSGALGLEFLSRYPVSDVIFTDNCSEAIDIIKKNLSLIKETAIVDKLDAMIAVNKYAQKSDVIFIDPPYTEFSLGCAFVKKISNIVKQNTIIVWEVENINKLAINEDIWQVYKDKVYGRARFVILIKK